MTNYIYDDTEVRLTGREATKHNGPGAARRTAPRSHLDIKVEITPAELSAGSWKRWVKRDELYTITENTNAE